MLGMLRNMMLMPMAKLKIKKGFIFNIQIVWLEEFLDEL